MKLTFPIKRSLFVAVGMFFVLVAVEMTKGHGFRTAVRFGVLWSAISTSIVIVTSIYYSRKGRACPVCNDLKKSL